MNQRVKKLWLKALRSGKYKQGKHILRSKDNKFCCLGVLCDIYAREKKIRWETKTRADMKEVFAIGKYKNSEYLPEEVAEWAEIQHHSGGYVKIRGKEKSLPIFNDSGYKFTTIANAIEKQI